MFLCPQAKYDAGVTFDDIAGKLGLTNVYVAQIFHQQVGPRPPLSWSRVARACEGGSGGHTLHICPVHVDCCAYRPFDLPPERPQ